MNFPALPAHRAPNGIITLGWESTPGSESFVEVSDSGKYWTVRRTRIVATGTTTIFSERPLPADRRRLYRVVKQ